jgi:hypothetical protein
VKLLKNVLVLLVIAAACAVVFSIPGSAQAPAAGELQVVTSGTDGVAAAGVACEKVRHARLCFQGSKPTCPVNCF